MIVQTSQIVRFVQDENDWFKRQGYVWITLGQFIYIEGDKVIKVPRGFLSDGATKAPDYGSAWVFHDYLYATHKFTSGQECTREEADQVMYNILKHERLNVYAFIFKMFIRMNPFNIFTKAWENSGKRGLHVFGNKEINNSY